MRKTLREVFADLSYGHLSNLVIGSEGNGLIDDKHHGRIISLLNQGLDDLHGRFLLRERSLLLRAITGKTSYLLRREHAFTHPGDGGGINAWIVDSQDQPFTGDVLKVLNVTDEIGAPVTVNTTKSVRAPGVFQVSVEKEGPGLFTVDAETVEIPQPKTGDFYHVNYQARHPKLVNVDGDVEVLAQTITLPSVTYAALSAYVASQIFSGLGGPENSQKGLELMGLFEAACQQFVFNGTVKTSNSHDHSKLEERGFV